MFWGRGGFLTNLRQSYSQIAPMILPPRMAPKVRAWYPKSAHGYSQCTSSAYTGKIFPKMPRKVEASLYFAIAAR